MAKIMGWIGFFLLMSAALTTAATGPEIHAGEWKITVRFDIPGLPMKMPPNTYTQCIEQDQPVPKSEKPNQTCEIKDVQTKGDTVTWTVDCTNRGGRMTGKGRITYKGDQMQGTMTMNMEGQRTDMISHYKGVRIGDCE